VAQYRYIRGLINETQPISTDTHHGMARSIIVEKIRQNKTSNMLQQPSNYQTRATWDSREVHSRARASGVVTREGRWKKCLPH